MFFTDLKCIRCGRPAEDTWKFDECPHCIQEGVSANYSATIDLTPGKTSDSFLLNDQPGIFKYRRLYAIKPDTKPVSLYEGDTPLIPLDKLGKKFALTSFYAKDETRNPTWSHKDRLSALGVTKARETGFPCVIVSSTGNQGISAAAYAAKASMHAVVLTSITSPKVMKTLMQSYGAMVFQIPTSAERTALVEKCVRELGFFPLTGFGSENKGANPYAIDGYKSLAFELVKQLGSEPDQVVFAIAGGDSLVGTWKGFVDLYHLGLIKKLPQMIAAEPLGPLTKTVAAQSQIPLSVKKRPTVAFAVASPKCTYQALKVIYDSKGDAVTVDDSDIMQAQEDLAVNEGIFVEPSSAVSLAAVKQLVKTGRLNRGDKIVAVLTSTGLKESESAAARLAEPPVIEPTIEALTETMKRFYHLVI